MKTCPQMRRYVVRHTKLNDMPGQPDVKHEEWKQGPCGRPVAEGKEKCDLCLSGFSVPDNKMIPESLRGVK